MQAEMELNRDDRKKLVEIMLEYPPGRRSQEQTGRETDQQDQKRKYTCLNCKRTFSAPTGKRNHVKRNHACRQVHQKETFGGRCQDRNRTFRAPSELRQNQLYICADLKRPNPTQSTPDGATGEEEAEGQQESRGEIETRAGGTEMMPREISGEMAARPAKGEEEKPHNRHSTRGKPRKPKESKENNNGSLRCNAETEKWQCAQCGKQYAETDARGA